MSVARLPDEQLLQLALEAIGDSAPERLRPLLHPSIEIRTERGSHRGVDAASVWAAKSYDHVQRRFEVDRVEELGDGLLATGRVEYVWTETRAIGDSSPSYLVFRRTDGLLSHLSLYDDRESAAEELGG